jgi:hypothetical protein
MIFLQERLDLYTNRIEYYIDRSTGMKLTYFIGKLPCLGLHSLTEGSYLPEIFTIVPFYICMHFSESIKRS